MVQDKQFWTSLTFTLKYALFVTPCLFILAFILALLVNGTFRGVNIFRTLFFSPVVISMTCCSMIWLWIYNDLYGVMNYLLQMTGLIKEPILWMNSAKTSLPAVIFMVTWKMSGFSMLIILAAFQGVDDQVYEAARVDGAGWVAQFFKITLPIIKPQVALAMIMSVTGSVLAFEQFSIMTKGGPSQLTTTSVHYIYNTSFNYFKLGYGSAMTVILLLILGALSFLQYTYYGILQTKGDSYERNVKKTWINTILSILFNASAVLGGGHFFKGKRGDLSGSTYIDPSYAYDG